MLHPFHPDQHVWVCPECKSVDVVDTCYVNANTNEVIDTCDSHRWCQRCEDDGNYSELKYFNQVPYSESREYQESQGTYVHPSEDA